MDVGGVPLLTILVAIAGPLGVTLGWWLGRRSERERALREERKLAYAEFVRAIFDFRSADAEKRREIRNDRWVAFATLVLVAPPAVFQASWRLLSVQERLLEDVDGDVLKSIQDEIWTRFTEYASLARADLGVRHNPFGQLRPATSRSGPPVLDAEVWAALEERRPTI